MRQLVALLLPAALAARVGRAEEVRPLLLQKPTVNRTHVVLVHGDDLWCVSRGGTVI